MSSTTKVHIHNRDAVRYILANLNDYYTMEPPKAFHKALDKVYGLSKQNLGELRKRQFGTLPNTESKAIIFLKESFARYEEDLEDWWETESESSETSETSSSSSDTDSVSTASTDRTVPINLNKYSIYSQEI